MSEVQRNLLTPKASLLKKVISDVRKVVFFVKKTNLQELHPLDFILRQENLKEIDSAHNITNQKYKLFSKIFKISRFLFMSKFRKFFENPQNP